MNQMRFYVLAALLIFSAAVKAQDPADRTHILTCQVGEFSIKSFEIYADEQTILDVVRTDGTVESRVVDLTNFYNGGTLFLGTDGELNLSVRRARVDQIIFDYTLEIDGDGFKQSVPLSCGN